MLKPLCERALPHCARTRRLGAVWAQLDPATRQLLVTHYTPRSGWPPGVTAMLGTVAAVAVPMTTDSARLEMVCCHALASNQAVIRRERGRAERAVNRAHRAWREAKDASMSAWVWTG